MTRDERLLWVQKKLEVLAIECEQENLGIQAAELSRCAFELESLREEEDVDG